MRLRNVVYFLVIGFASILFTSCLSVKSVTASIKNEVSVNLKPEKVVDFQNIILKTDNLPKMDSAAVVTKVESYFIPAILFWSWQNKLKCQLNTNYFVNILSDEIVRQQEEFQLNNLLINRKLEINIESVPTTFFYDNQGFFYFVLVAYGYSTYEGIQPTNQKFQLSYRLLEGDKVLKSETFVQNYNAAFTDKWVGNLPLIKKYMAELNKNYEKDCETFVSKIVEGLY